MRLPFPCSSSVSIERDDYISGAKRARVKTRVKKGKIYNAPSLSVCGGRLAQCGTFPSSLVGHGGHTTGAGTVSPVPGMD